MYSLKCGCIKISLHNYTIEILLFRVVQISRKLSTILSNAVCEGLFQRISCNLTKITLALTEFDFGRIKHFFLQKLKWVLSQKGMQQLNSWAGELTWFLPKLFLACCQSSQNCPITVFSDASNSNKALTSQTSI